mmetsp:Transcript_98079/g.255627  ORF Transcript_98079/g.255627 Transcript_98079/m.255627 type:complete len:249 (-) Transcript_98079:1146-1892(-)
MLGRFKFLLGLPYCELMRIQNSSAQRVCTRPSRAAQDLPWVNRMGSAARKRAAQAPREIRGSHLLPARLPDRTWGGLPRLRRQDRRGSGSGAPEDPRQPPLAGEAVGPPGARLGRVGRVQPPPLLVHDGRRGQAPLARGGGGRRQLRRGVRGNRRGQTLVQEVPPSACLPHVPRGAVGRRMVAVLLGAVGVCDAGVCVSQALSVDNPASTGWPEANHGPATDLLVGWPSQVGSLQHVVAVDIAVLTGG